MNKIFKNKFLILFFLFFSLIFIFNNFSYGFDTNEKLLYMSIPIKQKTNYDTDDCYRFILYKDSNNDYYGICYDVNRCSVSIKSDNISLIFSKKSQDWLNGNDFNVFKYNNNQWEFYKNNDWGYVNWYKYEVTGIEFIISDEDIYHYNDNTVPFFQKTPVGLLDTQLEGKLQVKEVMETETPKIIQTILGLLVLLIPLLIFLLAFWKAWRLLLNLLHKA